MANAFELKAILSAVDKLSPVLKGIQGAAKSTRKYLGDIGTAAGNVAGQIGLPLAALAGIAGGGLLLAAKRAVTDFASAGAALDDMSKRTGLTSDQLQLLAYQGEMADVSIEALQGSVGKLQRNLGDALGGKNKDLAALFAKLRINMRGADGQARSMVDLLPELADAFERNADPVKRARMGMALFGKSYAEILPLLVDGRAGLEKSRKEWDRLGFKLSAKDVERAAELDDTFVRLQKSTSGLFVSIGSQLAPAITPLLQQLVEMAARMRNVIAQDLGKYAKDLAERLKDVNVEKLWQDLKGFASTGQNFIATVGGMKTVLTALAAVMLAGPLVSLLALTGAVVNATVAFGGMAAAAYLAGNAALLAFLRTGVVALAVSGGPLALARNAFLWLAGAAASSGGIISAAMGAVSLAIRGIGAALMANPLGIILGLATAAYLIITNWDKVKAWFGSFFDWIGEKWKSLTGWIGEIVDLAGSFFGIGGGGGAVQAPGQSGGGGPSLATAGGQRFAGSMTVDFRNAPPGMRVADANSTPGFNLDSAVGYRGFATD